MAWELDLDLEDYEPEDAFTSDDSLASECVAVAPTTANGKVIDIEAVERHERARRALNVARAMYERGLLTDETLAVAYPTLWDKVARKLATKAECARALSVWRSVFRWLEECKPSIDTIVSTGLTSVTLRKLGTSEAASASRKIRDWHKVTRYKLAKAQEANEPEAYQLALRFTLNLLAGFMNTRYWAVAENARSVEDRALGGNNCKYNAVGAPKSAYRLVIHNQMGVQVSPTLRKREPVYIQHEVDSPESPTESIQPFPKVQHKKSKLRKYT